MIVRRRKKPDVPVLTLKRRSKMKPGYKTTEFWITTATILWSTFGIAVPGPWNIIVPVVAGGIYTMARGLAKGGVLKGTVGRDLSAM